MNGYDPTAPPPPYPGPVALDNPGYAHIVQQIFPGGNADTNLISGFSISSIYTPEVPDDGSHSLIQTWMTSGVAFSSYFAGGDCSPVDGDEYPPCIQSVEVGWDVDPADAAFYLMEDVDTGMYAPHLFGFATGDGYNTGCYDGIDDFGGDCGPTWIATEDAPFILGGILASNDDVDDTRYELVTQVEAGEDGWWVNVALNDLTGDGYTLVPIGYYDYSGYEGGVMASGQAQEFQAGAEVLDGDVNSDDGYGEFTVPMGNNSLGGPAYGFGGAAYVYDIIAADTTDTSYFPIAVGPDTVPAYYTYAYSGIGSYPNFAWNLFYLGGGLNTYIWQSQPQPFPYFGVEPPDVAAPYEFPLPIGFNSVTLAPVYTFNDDVNEAVFNLYVLSTSSSSGNNEVYAFSSYPSGFAGTFGTVPSGFLGESPLYLAGLTADGASGALWGWDSSNYIYTNEGESWANTVQSGFTSVGVNAPDSIFSTSTSSDGCSGSPSGGCLFVGSSPTDTWSNFEAGGVQVVLDQVAEELYRLDSSGQVWQGWEGAISTATCADDDVWFSQIAAKNGIVYGLDPYGTVWFYGGVMGNCWSMVGDGTMTGFAVSIATDNNVYSPAGVWASDTYGTIWTAE